MALPGGWIEFVDEELLTHTKLNTMYGYLQGIFENGLDDTNAFGNDCVDNAHLSNDCVGDDEIDYAGTNGISAKVVKRGSDSDTLQLLLHGKTTGTHTDAVDHEDITITFSNAESQSGDPGYAVAGDLYFDATLRNNGALTNGGYPCWHLKSISTTAAVITVFTHDGTNFASATDSYDIRWMVFGELS